MRRFSIYLILAGCLLLTACTAGTASIAPTVQETPSKTNTIPPQGQPTHFVPTNTSIPATPSPEPLTAAQLQGALLVLADFPAGWEIKPPDNQVTPDDGPTFDFLCQHLARRSRQTVKSEFVKDALAPIVTHQIAQYRPGDAAQTLIEMAQAVQSCPTWQTTDANGVIHTWKANLITYPQQGEKTLAISLTTSSESYGVVSTEVVYFLQGNALEMVQFMNLGEDTVDHDLFTRLVQMAASRIQQAVQP